MFKYILLLLVMLTAVPVQAVDVKTYIPTKAYPILPIIRDEIKLLDLKLVDFWVASSMEKESCITLVHGRCFSPESQLLTYWDTAKTRERERGIGLPQLTRTFRKDGSLRFDTLTELSNRYPKHLGALTWKNVRQRPDLQIKAKLLLMNETYSKLPTVKTAEDRHAMVVSAYNSGYKRLSTDRQTCKIAKGCDPNRWWGNVESIKAPGFATTPLYGHKSAWHLNRNHVMEIFKVRVHKYKRWYSENP
jgi:hypothetical protein